MKQKLSETWNAPIQMKKFLFVSKFSPMKKKVQTTNFAINSFHSNSFNCKIKKYEKLAWNLNERSWKWELLVYIVGTELTDPSI